MIYVIVGLAGLMMVPRLFEDFRTHRTPHGRIAIPLGDRAHPVPPRAALVWPTRALPGR